MDSAGVWDADALGGGDEAKRSARCPSARATEKGKNARSASMSLRGEAYDPKRPRMNPPTVRDPGVRPVTLSKAAAKALSALGDSFQVWDGDAVVGRIELLYRLSEGGSRWCAAIEARNGIFAVRPTLGHGRVDAEGHVWFYRQRGAHGAGYYYARDGSASTVDAPSTVVDTVDPTYVERDSVVAYVVLWANTVRCLLGTNHRTLGLDRGFRVGGPAQAYDGVRFQDRQVSIALPLAEKLRAVCQERGAALVLGDLRIGTVNFCFGDLEVVLHQPCDGVYDLVGREGRVVGSVVVLQLRLGTTPTLVDVWGVGDSARGRVFRVPDTSRTQDLARR